MLDCPADEKLPPVRPALRRLLSLPANSRQTDSTRRDCDNLIVSPFAPVACLLCASFSFFIQKQWNQFGFCFLPLVPMVHLPSDWINGFSLRFLYGKRSVFYLFCSFFLLSSFMLFNLHLILCFFYYFFNLSLRSPRNFGQKIYPRRDTFFVITYRLPSSVCNWSLPSDCFRKGSVLPP